MGLDDITRSNFSSTAVKLIDLPYRVRVAFGEHRSGPVAVIPPKGSSVADLDVAVRYYRAGTLPTYLASQSIAPIQEGVLGGTEIEICGVPLPKNESIEDLPELTLLFPNGSRPDVHVFNCANVTVDEPFFAGHQLLEGDDRLFMNGVKGGISSTVRLHDRSRAQIDQTDGTWKVVLAGPDARAALRGSSEAIRFGRVHLETIYLDHVSVENFNELSWQLWREDFYSHQVERLPLPHIGADAPVLPDPELASDLDIDQIPRGRRNPGRSANHDGMTLD